MNKNAALTMLALAAFLTPFMGSAVNLALPAIGAEFKMDLFGLSWLVTSFLLSAAVFLVPMGRLSDIHGRRRIFLAGSCVFAASSLLCCLAPSGSFLMAGRVLQGLGSSMIFGTSTAILTSVFPPKERGRALGIFIASVYLGTTLGPGLGGLMVQHLGWRSLFAAVALMGGAVAWMSAAQLEGEWAEAKGERFDLAGSALYGLATVSLLYGSTLLPSWNGAVLALCGALLFAFFVILERRIEHPVFDVRLLFGNRVFAMSSLASLINYSATFAVGFVLSLHLQCVLGMEPSHCGMILLASPVAMAAVSPLAGALSDKADPGKVASAGMGLVAVGLLALTWISATGGIPYIVLCQALLGAGFGLFSSPNTNAIMGSVAKEHLGVASSTIGTVRLFGQMASMGVASTALSLFVGRASSLTHESAPQFLKAARLLFLVFCALCVLGVFASLARGRKSDGGVQA